MIELDVQAGVATLSVPDLPRLTRHDGTLGRALRDAIHDLDERDDVKAVLLVSPGEDFCADVPAGDGDGLAAFAPANGLYQTWCFSRKVTLAAVQGRCAGAGTLLALHADLVVAADDASFASPFALLAEASVVTTALTIGLARTKAWMMSGHILPAAEAEVAGFVNAVVPRIGLREAAGRLARTCCRTPLDGIAMSKLMVDSYMDGQGAGEEFDHVPFYAAALGAA